jgi:hypothetical protein
VLHVKFEVRLSILVLRKKTADPKKLELKNDEFSKRHDFVKPRHWHRSKILAHKIPRPGTNFFCKPSKYISSKSQRVCFIDRPAIIMAKLHGWQGVEGINDRTNQL